MVSYSVTADTLVTNQSDNYLLGTPKFLAVDKNGQILVGDDLALQFLYFDQEGYFLKKIGLRGRGPGEFLNISAMVLNSRNELLVADQFNSRFTIFRKNDDVETSLYDPSEILWPRNILDTGNGYILFYRLDYPVSDNLSDSTHGQSGNYLFHFSKDLKSIEYSFGNINDFEHSESTFYKTWSLFAIGSALTKNNSLLFAPFLYDGKIYKYDLDKFTHQTFTGLKIHDQPFTSIYGPPIPKHAIQINGRTAAAATIESESLGLFELENGNIIHFSFQVSSEERKITFEIFEKNLILQKTGILEGFGAFQLSHNSSIFDIHATDGKHTFYAIDKRDRSNELVITFKIDKL
tara:strand:- start:15339 stop:16385 length:1047 start_codon:yes stop_codon:yes gene_type:complete